MLIIPLASWCNAPASLSINPPSRLPVSSLRPPHRGIRKRVFCLGDCHHHHSLTRLKKITIITTTQEGLASAPIAAVTKAPVVDVLSGTIAADTVTAATTAAITGTSPRVLKCLLTRGVPQIPKKQKPTDPAEPALPWQRRS